jgi:hypothetical protein
MGAVTFQGYYTGTYNPDRGGIFTAVAWHPGPITIQFDGDLLSPGDTLNNVDGVYYGSIDPDGLTSVLTAPSAFGGPTVLYSNDPNLLGGIPREFAVQRVTFTCLLAGTLIATPNGERRVEDLSRGDLVLTATGEPVAIRWIGRQSAVAMFAGPEAVPVLIRAGALADGIPASDLCVSPDHAIFVDGVLANARALVNGMSIVPMPQPPDLIEYYHLELDRHRLITANGTLVESFVDDVSRASFDNVDEWHSLDLEPLPAASLPYVKVKSARQLPQAIDARLAARAAADVSSLQSV